MIIRSATIMDALALMEGAKDFAKFTGLPIFPEKNEDFISAVSRIVTHDAVDVILAEHEGAVIGGIGIIYGQSLWNPAIIMGEEIFWWAFPKAPMKTGKRLYDEAIRRIEEKNAIPYFKSLPNSPDSVEKLYIRDGFVPIDRGWIKIK